MKKKVFNKISYPRYITIGFFTIVFIGAILLSMPISSSTGGFTPFCDALFTSTSATCVTGLIIYDTYTHWSLFGKIIILILMQTGGLGFMTIISMIFILLKKKIGVHDRRLLMQSAGTMHLNGIIRLIKKIFIGTVIFELIGAAVLFTQFIKTLDFKNALFFSVFHSVSAFCNAGFDLMGKFEPFSSMTLFYNNYVILTTIMILITIGGVGFIVWNDVVTNKLNFKKYELHSKIALTVTFVLTAFGTLIFYFTEDNGIFLNMTTGERILNSFFLSVSPRTAGFNSVNLNKLSNGGVFTTILYMFIGGSPGSTAGGIKTTTVAVLILGTIKQIKHNECITIYKYRLEDDSITQACAVLIICILTTLLSSFIITVTTDFGITDTVFEVASAIGTVGLTLGITPSLDILSKIIITLLMFFGRVGGLTLMVSLLSKNKPSSIKRPEGKILIG